MRGDTRHNKSIPYLGFGSLEALAKALRPKKPIPDEVGAKLWKQIEEQIRRTEAGSAGPGPADGPAGPWTSPALPAVVPALAPALAPALLPAGQAATVLIFTKGTFDIAGAAAFLASDDASWITGEVLYVAGGQ